MYEYTINIGEHNGKLWNSEDPAYKHLFRVSLGKDGDGSGDLRNAEKVIAELKDKFPAPDYKVTVSRRQNVWTVLD